MSSESWALDVLASKKVLVCKKLVQSSLDESKQNWHTNAFHGLFENDVIYAIAWKSNIQYSRISLLKSTNTVEVLYYLRWPGSFEPTEFFKHHKHDLYLNLGSWSILSLSLLSSEARRMNFKADLSIPKAREMIMRWN